MSAPGELGPPAAPHQLPVAICCSGWLLKKDEALLPMMQLPVTLVAPTVPASLTTPPPLPAAVLHKIRLPSTVVLPEAWNTIY